MCYLCAICVTYSKSDVVVSRGCNNNLAENSNNKKLADLECA